MSFDDIAAAIVEAAVRSYECSAAVLAAVHGWSASPATQMDRTDYKDEERICLVVTGSNATLLAGNHVPTQSITATRIANNMHHFV